jgi:hypothetical protein
MAAEAVLGVANLPQAERRSANNREVLVLESATVTEHNPAQMPVELGLDLGLELELELG